MLQQGKLPRQYVLNYYADENKRRLKGTIALDECEQASFYFSFNYSGGANRWGGEGHLLIN